MDAVSSVINRCVVCRKKMTDLPEDCFESNPPFSYSAVTCFGPWRVKDRGREVKRYGVRFTCLASRAVHLEIANTMDASSFLNACQRFVGRRDPVRHLRSDRGTNLRYLRIALKDIDNNKTRTPQRQLRLDRVQDECAASQLYGGGGLMEASNKDSLQCRICAVVNPWLLPR